MGYSCATYEVYFNVNSTVNPPIPRGHQALTSDRPGRLTSWGGQAGEHEDMQGRSDTEDARSL